MRRLLSYSLVLTGLLVFGLTYGPLLTQEFKQYQRSMTPVSTTDIRPVNDDFGIVIPKIGANSLVVAEVDPLNANEYQQALSTGVAHAKGSVKPGEQGSVFLFAHSSVNFFEAAKYNSVFYLLHWLKPGDEIWLFYQQKKYIYRVDKLERVRPDRVDYLYQFQPLEKLVLMTCWPPGTSLQRMMVTAMLVE